MTFVGFKVDDMGQYKDIKPEEPIKGFKVPPEICHCLFIQGGVNLQNEDCNKLSKYAKCVNVLIILFDLQYC